MSNHDFDTIRLLHRTMHLLENVTRVSAYEIKQLKDDLLLQTLYLEREALERARELAESKAKKPFYTQVVDFIRKIKYRLKSTT